MGVDEGKWSLSEDGELIERGAGLLERAQRPTRMAEAQGWSRSGKLGPLSLGASRGRLTDRSMASERRPEALGRSGVWPKDLRSKLLVSGAKCPWRL